MDITKQSNEILNILWQAKRINPVLKQQIELEYKKRSNKYNRYYIEDFFIVNFIKGRTAAVTFIPGSEAQKMYGSNISVEMVLDDKGIEEMIKNCQQKVRTIGKIKSNKLANEQKLNQQQLNNLEKIGFHTADVLEVLSLT